MTVPLDETNDIREMDAAGIPRAEIAHRLRRSRNTVAKYADMPDMSPAAPSPHPRVSRALSPDDAAWVDVVLEADRSAPRKQRHTAKRIYDRLVAERSYKGSYSTIQRHVRAWRAARHAGSGEGYLELDWAPGTAQVDYGNFEAVVTGERLALKLLAVSLPHSNARYAAACMSQRSECMCDGLSKIFSRIGRAAAQLQRRLPRTSRRWPRCPPIPSTRSGGCVPARTSAGTSRWTGASTWPARPGTPGSCWWACGRRRWRFSPTGAGAWRFCRVPGAPASRFAESTPLSLVPALIARPRAFGESTIRRDMPGALVEGIDRMDVSARRRTLRSISRVAEASGFEAACGAALRIVEGGRVPDDATVDMLARRIAAGGPEAAGGADLSVYDGFLKGGAAHAC